LNTMLRNKESEKDYYRVKLPIFEGPFDLLFHLVKKEELDIWEISLSRITDQYLQYLHSMKDYNMDVAGDFLVMAASLLHLKSRMMLPQPASFLQEFEEDALFFGSKEDLVRCLLEYSRIKSAAAIFKDREQQQARIFLRSPDRPQRVVIINRQCSLYPYNLDSLKQAYQQLKDREINKNKKKEFVTFKQEFSFGEKIRQIISILRKYTSFHYYIDDFLVKKENNELVVTFFALLELARRGRLSLRQETLFGKILISRVSEQGKK
jgi:segregation and condensation protein A